MATRETRSAFTGIVSDEEDCGSIDSDDLAEKQTYLGRIYQAYSLVHEISMFPVDDEEEARLRSEHDLLKKIFHDRRNPLLPDNVIDPENILECGFGSGDWAHEVAEAYPRCKVEGVDISASMVLDDMPANLKFELADLNDPSVFPVGPFDFVHSRFVMAGVARSRWPSFLTDIKRVLRPGGWVEFTEWDPFFRSDSGNADRAPALRRWSEIYLQAISSGEGNGRKSRSVHDELETMMRASGFVNVKVNILEIPTCAWPTNNLQRSWGLQNRQNMEKYLTAAALFPVVGRGFMSEKAFRELVRRAADELGDLSSKPFLRLYNGLGQKS